MKRGHDAGQAFYPSETWKGAMTGYVFKRGGLGQGYYLDGNERGISQVPAWKNPKLDHDDGVFCSTRRKVKLKVEPKRGADLTLEAVHFGFLVEAVGEVPQEVQAGDVICKIEERSLEGLSADQMAASFRKRLEDEAELEVAAYSSLEKETIQEMWDDHTERPFWQNKKNLETFWTKEEALKGKRAGPSQNDLSSFLVRGFGKERKLKPKKKKETLADLQPAADNKKEDHIAKLTEAMFANVTSKKA